MSRILPILFNTDMVQAILDGRKTSTRRVIKFHENRFTGKIPKADKLKVYKNTIRADKISFHEEPNYAFDVKPLCKPGDILYVRETWQRAFSLDENENIIEGTEHYYYASGPETPPFDYWLDSETGEHKDRMPWRPSIHMPKAAARIWLKVTDVRVERLQDIDGQEVLKEGINSHVHPKADYFNMNQREAFEELWNFILKKADQDSYGWDANPWVWVIEFERCDKPEGWCV